MEPIALRKTRAWTIRNIERLFGTRQLRGLSTSMVKLGLRGLGVKNFSDVSGGNEEWFLKKALTALREPVCADIGANIGEYALLCRKHGAGKVLAFEPAPDAFRALVENTRSDPAIECILTAVGERDGIVEIFVPERSDDSQLASRDANITSFVNDPHNKISVPLIKLDDFVQARGLRLNFIKIDVEGYEMEVFLGASDTIATQRPIIQFEFNSHHLYRRQNMLDFAAMLNEYALYRLARSSLIQLDPGHYLSNLFAYQNIIAIPDEMTALKAMFS
jgi:FkbM family methyltransferase